MTETSHPVSQAIPAAKLVSAAALTAAAIQSGKLDAGNKAAVAEYFHAIHQELFGKQPWE